MFHKHDTINKFKISRHYKAKSDIGCGKSEILTNVMQTFKKMTQVCVNQQDGHFEDIVAWYFNVLVDDL